MGVMAYLTRLSGSKRDGGGWSEQEKLSVWLKGSTILGYSPSEFRTDKYNGVMQYSKHGNRNDKMGWEIDHIIPVARDGSDNYNNLQPLTWEHNLAKGDK